MQKEVGLRRLATIAWLLSIVTWVAFAVLATTQPVIARGAPVLEIFEVLGFVILGTFGYLIVRRLPTNLLGWQAMGPGLAFPIEWLASDLAEYRVLTLGTGDWLAQATGWVALWAWIPATFTVPFLFLLFPDGKVPSRRWRIVLFAFIALMILAFLIAVISLVVRFRQSGPLVRAQIKWLALAGILAIPFFALSSSAIPFFALSSSFSAIPVIGSVLNVALTVGLGGSIMVAVLRYRLYEIDRLVSRTVIYALVALILAGVYLAVVIAHGSQLGQDNSLAVAGSTLATAALFSPVRSRVQTFVERRFDRARYDAQLVVDNFSSRLRDEVDLESLVGDLAAVVDRTMRPANVSLWPRRLASAAITA
ncbi:MAG: hypothetical protein LC739_11400 [Actinobacteria bacterium]|nr:hypothetical protein [Actinomycetota bacterium]